MTKDSRKSEIDKIDDKKRAEVQERIDKLGASINSIVLESHVTSLPAYLRGGKIQSGTLYILERTLTRMEKEKAEAETESA